MWHEARSSRPAPSTCALRSTLQEWSPHAGAQVLRTAAELVREQAMARRLQSADAIACVAALTSLRACTADHLSAVACASSGSLEECSSRQISVMCRMLADASVRSGAFSPAVCPAIAEWIPAVVVGVCTVGVPQNSCMPSVLKYGKHL